MPNPFFCDWNSLRGKSLPHLTPTTNITITSVDGQGILAACYLPAGGTVDCNTLRPTFEALKIPHGVLPPHVKLFNARGLITGDRIWLSYSDVAGNAATSDTTTVRVDAFDKSQGTDGLAEIPELSFILLDSYGFSQRVGYTPNLLTWRQQVNATLKTIYGNALGKSLLHAVGQKFPQQHTRVSMLHREAPHLPVHVDHSNKLIIRPYLGEDPNADSGISFSPDRHDGTTPGSLPEEILFHELTHLTDGEFDGYTDAEGFAFDGADFFSITATNVFSSSLNRSLRKDHHGHHFMPVKFASDPAQFAKSFRTNIQKVAQKAPVFHKALTRFDRSGLWNPFLAHLPDFVPVT